jgi:hypothetical protein
VDRVRARLRLLLLALALEAVAVSRARVAVRSPLRIPEEKTHSDEYRQRVG